MNDPLVGWIHEYDYLLEYKGINKMGKLKEISSRLLKLRPTIAILIETRVKRNKANSIRERLQLPNNYLDDYNCHENGRVWIEWDRNKVDIKHITSSSQFIHVEVHDVQGVLKYWLIVVYAYK